MEFTHLHVHSHYSVLDGMSKVPDLIDKCMRTGMHAMALTDHGAMFGIKEFLDYAKKVNSKPKNKVKECKELIAKAKEQIAAIPEWEAQLSVEQNEHERDTLQQRIKDAREAQANLPSLEAQLPELEQALAAFQPFKPIVGVEAYCARRNRLLKDKNVKATNGEGKEIIVDRSGWHLILLAKNMTGYRNLCKIVSQAYIDGFYDRPRIDKQLLEQYHEGIIVSSACLGGELPQLILSHDIDKAEQTIEWFKSIFGDDYYIEIMRHRTTPDNPAADVYLKQQEVNPILIDLAHKHGVKIICTNDAHFLEEEHAEAHDRLICLSTGAKLEDERRLHYTKQEWLKTPEQMRELFSDIPEALDNTQDIVNKVEVYDIDSKPIMPLFPIPEEFGTEQTYRQRFTEQELFDEFTRNEHGEVVLTDEEAQKKVKNLGGYDRLYRIKLEADYLAKLTWEGAHQRYGDNLTDEQKERIIFELHVMKTMGFPGYFLIVMDYIRAAREELGVSVGPGRGSAAGSVVAYCLRITDLDPLKYDLLFERFLNPDRISLPDIDVDFDDAGREKVLDWVSNKYGKTHVAHIITYGVMASKSALADVGRIQSVPLSEVNDIKKLIPDKFPDDIKDKKGKTPKVNLHNCYEYVPELKQLVHGDRDDLKTMLHYAEELEDTIRQTGIHACGVIIGADDLTNFAPLATIKDRATDKDIIVTQYDGHVVESVGLIKMDFLGLRTLTIIKETLKNIAHSKGREAVPDIDHIPTDDPLTYRLFQEGRTIAVFQFESPGMQKHMKNLQPTQIGDLIAMNALYRPGPMDYIDSFIARKHGREPITYDIPVMEKYLKETYGITVYQEQVMLLSRLLAGFSRGQADSLRKAMGKKIFAMLADLKPKFIEGGKKNGHDPQVLEKIWRDWEAFASYAFNKSHAACYAWVAYQTAYLKAHFPAEFMAANLTVSKDDITAVTKLMDECKALHINVLEPDVNESELNFTVNAEGHIRFGLGGILGIGESAVEAITSERDKNGKFNSIYDFLERVNLQACNKKAVESLAISGAFDCFTDIYREQITYINENGDSTLDQLIKYGNMYQQDKASQQNSLFSDFGMGFGVDIAKPQLPLCEKKSAIEKLNDEKKYIGMFLSAHPLDEYEFEVKELCNITTQDLNYFSSFREAERRATFKTPDNAPTPIQWIGEREGRVFRLGGLVTAANSFISKKSNMPYGRYTIEDYDGAYELMLFSKNYQDFGPMLQVNMYVYITGTIQQRGANNPRFIPKQFDAADYEFSVTKVDLLTNMQHQVLRQINISQTISQINTDIITEITDLLNKQKQFVDNLRSDEKKNKIKEADRRELGEGALFFCITDDIHRNRVNLRSRAFYLHVNRPFYHWLRKSQAEDKLTYQILTQ